MEGFMKLFDWVTKLAYLNLLWIFFSLLGLLIFGVGPATVAIFAVIRKILRNDIDFSIWKQFRQVYQKEFWRANGLVLIIVPICMFLYMDFAIIQTLPSSFLVDKVVFTSVIILSLLSLILICYLFAVYVQFDLSFFENFKYALLISGINPFYTLLMVIGLFVFSLILLIIPAASLFYLISVPTLIIQMCAHNGFGKITKSNVVSS